MTMKTLEKRIETLTATINIETEKLHKLMFEGFEYDTIEFDIQATKIEALENELKILETEYNRKDTVMVWTGGLFLVTIAIVSGLMLYMIH